MKKIKSIALLLAVAALVLSSCSNDVLLADETGGNGPGTSYSGKSVFITAGVGLPTSAGTRSQTDYVEDENGDITESGSTNSSGSGVTGEDDFEYGYDYENDVRTMILVFATYDETSATNDNKFIAYSEVSGIEKAPTGAKYEFQVTAELKYEDLKAAYEGDNPLLKNSDDLIPVNVYAFCNYTSNLETILNSLKPGDSFIDKLGTVTEDASPVGHTPVVSNTIWAPRAFLMTNYEQTKVYFPNNLEGDYDYITNTGGWDSFADKSTPFYINSRKTQLDEDSKEPILSPIKVERSAARIDFRDGSKYADNDDPSYRNRYDITTDVHALVDNSKDSNGEKENDKKNLFSVQLTRMALVNMSKNFYYLRRVSADGQNDNAKIGGLETTRNYVVDTDAESKKIVSDGLGLINTGNAADYFNFPLFTEKGDYNVNGWYADKINDVLEGAEDTWTVSSSEGRKHYHIWRYVTENTIPAGPENQITIQSTGIVFKGRIIAGNDIAETYSSIDDIAKEERYVSAKVEAALNNAKEGTIDGKEIESGQLPILYSFDGFLYAGWEELIEKGAEDGIGGRLYTRVCNILEKVNLVLDGKTYKVASESKDDDEKLDIETAYRILKSNDLSETEENPYAEYSIELTDGDIRKIASQEEQITVYEPSFESDGEGWGYYCYYFYWNRHNDNEKSGIMGNMEFATVRNNVYKIYVESIAKFGHPRNRDDDPDPVDPEDPDEEPLRYIQVDVEVLPWVVRENKVTF